LDEPRNGFIELNFHGASKWNLENACFGGAFHTWTIDLIWLYVCNLREDTNNIVELTMLDMAPPLAWRQGYNRLIVRGFPSC